MALIIAGERSGVGKTTVTLALLAALKRRAQTVQSFKVGPDYIDPMFHRHVTGRACRNLDAVLTSEVYVRQCFAQHTQLVDCALIEGVMGLFDGATGAEDYASTAHVARLLDVPVLLILNCSSLARSIAAIAHGYSTFDPRVQVAGVVLNRVGSDRHLELLKAALEPLNLPILGVLRRQDDITIPDRHLGLVPTNELANLQPLLDKLAHLGETCFDWSKLMPLLACNPPALAPTIATLPPVFKSRVRVAIAQDAAFNFYYADNLELLETLGADPVYWSPLTDQTLPEGVQGLFFGGGFPEVFAGELAQNQPIRQAVQAAIQAGMPTYAECGGLMYLCREILDFAEQTYPMVGILPTTAQMGQRLTLGYRQATALQDSPLVRQGDRIWGHEFHRSTLADEAEQPLFQLQGYDSSIPLRAEGWRRYQVHASYTHLHFGAQPQLPKRFLAHCSQFIRNECDSMQTLMSGQ
jgi:cobyrinic acid a,c-diamide synthase